MAQITYDTKVALNSNDGVADINKVNASDMNEIKSVVNVNDTNMGTITNLKTTDKTSVVSSINELVDSQVCSSNEVKTNETWADGNPVYRKTYTLNIGTDTSYEQSISLPDASQYWIDGSNSYLWSNNISQPAGHYASSTDWSRFYLLSNKIVCSFGSTYSTISKVAYITIKYTKGE